MERRIVRATRRVLSRLGGPRPAADETRGQRPPADGVTVVLRGPHQPASPDFEPDADGPTHVLICDRPGGKPVEGEAAGTPETDALSKANDRLRRLGPVATLVDLGGIDGWDAVTAWHRLFLHVCAGGSYRIHRSALPAGASTHDIARRIASLRDHRPSRAPGHRRQQSEFQGSIGSVHADEDWVVVEKLRTHLARLSADDVTSVLPQREPTVSVRDLATASGGTFRAACTVTHHGGPPPRPPFPARIRFPSLTMHEYSGRVAVVRNSLIHTDTAILPESFRHHSANRQRNALLRDAGNNFSRVARGQAPTEVLEGCYYHVDSENPGHFGHIVSEDLSKLWGWEAAKREHPSLKLLFRTRDPSEAKYQPTPALELQLYGAFGIRPDDIVGVDHPVYVECLCSASPMVHNQVPRHVNPAVSRVWDRVRDHLVDVGYKVPGRVFLSRRPTYGRGNRACRNVAEVERFFEQEGFSIVYPEELSLGQQVALFAGARLIAGFAGSGMYGLVYARQQPTVLVLLHDAYTSRTEHLITAVRGGDVHYFWSRPDVPQPKRGWSLEAYRSSFEFDLDRHRGSLQRVISASSA